MSDAPSPEPLPPPSAEPERRSWGPLLIGGAALVISLAAAALVLSKRAVSSAPEPTASPSSLALNPPAPSGSAAPADPLGPNPLDYTKVLVDAGQRGRAWNADAVLASINVEVTDGRPSAPLTVRYGAPQGALGPGQRLGSKRLRVDYTNGKATQATEGAKASEVGVPDPNCPLDVAWQKATEAGIDRHAAVTMRYENSAKLRRAIWRVQRADDLSSRIIDGSTCTVVLR